MSYKYQHNNIIKNENIMYYILDINSNDKLQQIRVHLTIHGHLTYCHEHIMVQEYQNNHLKDFLPFFFYLVNLMEH